ncbi:hypothetical protein WN943_027058 [Citrus x changshan-huyou]
MVFLYLTSFFADDLLLLAEAYSKKARKISDSLGFATTDNLGKYLGIPLLHNRVTKAIYQETVDNVDKSLSGWNAMHLSLAGRITLAQSGTRWSIGTGTKNKCVVDFVDDEGNWNWIMFGHFLPNQIFPQITAIKPPSDEGCENQPFWAHSKSGNFTSKQSFFSLNIRDWLCFNLGKAGINEIMDDWACLFGITNLSSHIMHLAALKWSLKFNLGFMTSIMQNQASISNGLASAGGLVRDCSGKWQFSFGMKIGLCSVTSAELQGLFQGVRLAWDRGIHYLEAEVDNQCIFQVICSTRSVPNANLSLINAIKELMNRDWRISIKHIYREANFAADFMAKFAGSLPLSFHVFDNPFEGNSDLCLTNVYHPCHPIFNPSHLRIFEKLEIEMMKIENEDDRIITLSKRRSGIYKKANELVTLTNAEIGVVVPPPLAIVTPLAIPPLKLLQTAS